MSAIRKPASANAPTIIKKARFMIITFEFHSRYSCFLAQVSHRNPSKEQTSRKTQTDSLGTDQSSGANCHPRRGLSPRYSNQRSGFLSPNVHAAKYWRRQRIRIETHWSRLAAGLRRNREPEYWQTDSTGGQCSCPTNEPGL
jgi:hypothetical protein